MFFVENILVLTKYTLEYNKQLKLNNLTLLINEIFLNEHIEIMKEYAAEKN